MFKHFFLLSFFAIALLVTSPVTAQDNEGETSADMQI